VKSRAAIFWSRGKEEEGGGAGGEREGGGKEEETKLIRPIIWYLR
jgi:hypothetical protein